MERYFSETHTISLGFEINFRGGKFEFLQTIINLVTFENVTSRDKITKDKTNRVIIKIICHSETKFLKFNNLRRIIIRGQLLFVKFENVASRNKITKNKTNRVIIKIICRPETKFLKFNDSRQIIIRGQLLFVTFENVASRNKITRDKTNRAVIKIVQSSRNEVLEIQRLEGNSKRKLRNCRNNTDRTRESNRHFAIRI